MDKKRNVDPSLRRRGRPRHTEPSPEYRARLDEIVALATEVFRQKGYDAGSLEDVAKELGLRKASLYYYFESKSALLHLIFERAIDDALQRIASIAIIEDPRDRLEALIRHQAIRVASEPSLFTVFFDQRPSLNAADYNKILAKERAYVRAFADAAQLGRDAGILPDADPRTLADILLGMTNWSYKWFDPDRDDPEAFADICVALIFSDSRDRTEID